MKPQHYTTILTVDATASDVFTSINSVTTWWTEHLEGHSQQLNDAFTVRFGEIHVSTQKVVEFIPDKKVVWLVTESKLNFIKQQNEWNNTHISFEIAELGDKTQLTFTHIGLVPEIECYTGCSGGWDYYIKGSLFKLLTEGTGTPELK